MKIDESIYCSYGKTQEGIAETRKEIKELNDKLDSMVNCKEHSRSYRAVYNQLMEKQDELDQLRQLSYKYARALWGKDIGADGRRRYSLFTDVTTKLDGKTVSRGVHGVTL